MTPEQAAMIFQALLSMNGADIWLRDPAWLDYSEPANVFTRYLGDLIYVEIQRC